MCGCACVYVGASAGVLSICVLCVCVLKKSPPLVKGWGGCVVGLVHVLIPSI